MPFLGIHLFCKTKYMLQNYTVKQSRTIFQRQTTRQNCHQTLNPASLNNTRMSAMYDSLLILLTNSISFSCKMSNASQRLTK